MSTLIKCPHCGQATVATTTKGSVSNVAAHFGGGFAEGAAKALANDLLFDGAGAFVPKFGNKLANLVPLEYICKSCDCIFQASLSSDGDIKKVALTKLPMPVEIIEREREKYIQALRKKRPYVSTLILSLITLYLVIYMCIGVANESGVTIVLSLLMAIPFMIPTIFKFKKISALNHEIEDCEMQDAIEFKHSHRELFCQYKQYN